MSPFERFHAPESDERTAIAAGLAEYMEEQAEAAARAEDGETIQLPPDVYLAEELVETAGQAWAEQVYQWYAAAMQRSDKQPLDQAAFIDHFFAGRSLDTACVYGDDQRGYALGFTKAGVFIPTHFAPRGLRGGMRLMKELGTSQTVPSALAVTEDLAAMLDRLEGWQDSGVIMQRPFRGQLVDKHIFYNSHPEIEARLEQLLQQMMEQ